MEAKENSRLSAFGYYLKSENYQANSIREHLRNIERFTSWVNSNELTDIAQLNYTELLDYVAYLKKQNNSVATINIQLGTVRKYYVYLKSEDLTDHNPAKGLYIKGRVEKVVTDVLSSAELETLYNDYVNYCDTKPVREKKQAKVALQRKVIVGLMIWQGLHSGELAKLEPQHLQIDQGLIYIPSSARSNKRELKLAPKQIIPLYNYLSQLPQEQTKLFAFKMYTQMQVVTAELKGLNPRVQNGIHLRQSVIFHWLKMYGKRQVQYMSGHKWISSTEHYERQDIETLTSELEKHHPFAERTD